MKSKILKIGVIILIISVFLCGCGEEEKLTPTNNFFVNDFANVLTVEDESAIQSSAVTLYNQTTAQVVVVTLDDLNGKEISQFALELGREWGVGSKEDNNGIVVLLSENDREIYISVGYGLEGALTDSKTGRIIDRYGLEYLKNDNFSKGIREITSALINEVYIEYGLSAENGYVSIDNLPDETQEDYVGVSVSWVILIIILVFLSLLSRRRGGFIFFGGYPHYHGGGFSGGAGGFSGGGFRGGGGSFGGGGAGRGF